MGNMGKKSSLITVKLHSLKDQTLNTGAESIDLTEGEIFQGRFWKQKVIDGLIEIKVIKLAPSEAEIGKKIPVVYPPLEVIKLVSSSNVLRDSEGNEYPLFSLPPINT